jgi:hypothetical protein
LLIFFVGFANGVWENIARKRLLNFWLQKKRLLDKMLPPHVKLAHV